MQQYTPLNTPAREISAVLFLRSCMLICSEASPLYCSGQDMRFRFEDLLASIFLWMQEAMKCVRDFSHTLYGAYERYAHDATETWLAEIDGGLVRQVSA